jgi:hypothetical protein
MVEKGNAFKVLIIKSDSIENETIMQDKMLNFLPDFIPFVKSDEETSGFQKLVMGEESIQAY